jgi:hypothetical protein
MHSIHKIYRQFMQIHEQFRQFTTCFCKIYALQIAVVAQLAGGSVVAALVGIEDDAEWKIGTNENCSWAAMVDVVLGRGSVSVGL